MHGAEQVQAVESESLAGSSGESAPVFIDLLALVQDIRRRWAWIAAAAVIGLALAFLYLNIANVRFAGTLRVSPANSTQGSLSGALGRLGGLASLAGVQVRQGNEGASPFELYLDRMQSRAMAEELAKDPRILRTVFDREWDAVSGRFTERPGLLRPVRNLLYRFAGQPLPEWTPPGAEQLQLYFEKTLVITPPGPKDPPITTLSVRAKDGAFAVYLLERMHAQADADVRAAQLERARQYAAHLSKKLATAQIAEHRISLSEALLEQERAIMMATGSSDFAAIPLERPTSSSRPVSPKVVPALALGVVGGIFFGILSVAAAYVRRQIIGRHQTDIATD
jgi:LPS O-antigen subunit length determinant protein (WzzB/FepE family)